MKRVLFVILSALLTALFFLALGQDMTREWTGYQSKFFRTLSQAERQGISGGIKQIIVSDLNRIDRCTTCHLAIDKPQMALAEEPFTAHPGKYLAWHPVEQFGCTVCHGGQGLATEVKAAHGDVPHWEQPLLRGPLVQASCRQCHGNLNELSGYAPLLVKGRQLFAAKGCYGCHAIKDVGQSVSVDLAEVGSKSHQLIEADFENMPPPHHRIHWILTKLDNPRVLNPGVPQDQLPPGEEEVFPTAMPHFGLTPDERQALTVYLLSLTDANPPVSYTIPPEPQVVTTYDNDIDRGRAVFERLGCTGCHGPQGVGGRRNWNGGLGEEVPSLIYVKAYYGENVEALKEVIRTGRQPVPRADAARPQPGLYMPAWKDRMTDSDLTALVAYLYSLSELLPAEASTAAPAGDQATTVTN
ncbi:MAG: c-type cytochrome [Candidatus Omnitrophica bacterium]|nr:c-type cytochrome [Candidatus Omnitrophota bacterium]